MYIFEDLTWQSLTPSAKVITYLRVFDDWEKVAGSVDHHTFLKETNIVTNIIDIASWRPGHPVQILDVGCGTGFFWKYLPDCLPQDIRFKCWLVDCSPYRLDTFAETITNISWEERNVVAGKIAINAEVLHTAPELQGLNFDLILSLHSLYTIDPSKITTFGKTIQSFLAPMGVYWDLHYSEDFFDAELDKFYCSFKRIPLPYVFAEPFEAQLKQSMSEVKVQVLSYGARHSPSSD